MIIHETKKFYALKLKGLRQGHWGCAL